MASMRDAYQQDTGIPQFSVCHFMFNTTPEHRMAHGEFPAPGFIGKEQDGGVAHRSRGDECAVSNRDRRRLKYVLRIPISPLEYAFAVERASVNIPAGLHCAGSPCRRRAGVAQGDELSPRLPPGPGVAPPSPPPNPFVTRLTWLQDTPLILCLSRQIVALMHDNSHNAWDHLTTKETSSHPQWPLNPIKFANIYEHILLIYAAYMVSHNMLR